MRLENIRNVIGGALVRVIEREGDFSNVRGQC
jgi:hypothetical protein